MIKRQARANAGEGGCGGEGDCNGGCTSNDGGNGGWQAMARAEAMAIAMTLPATVDMIGHGTMLRLHGTPCVASGCQPAR